MIVACGNNNNASPRDGAIDSPIPADAPIDVPAPPMGNYQYVLDHMTVPQTNNQALADGLDLNGDQHVDNQLGMVLSAFSGMGFNAQTATTQAIDTGALLTLIDLYTDDFTTSTMPTFTTYDGANAFPRPCNGTNDTTCRHHLAGDAMFTLASAPTSPLTGTITAGELDAGPGSLEIQLAPFGPPAVKLALVGARIKLGGTTATAITNGTLGGGVLETDIQSKLYPAMQQSFTAVVERDCCGLATSPGGATCTAPACGCTDGSSGKTLISIYDSSHDCTISLSEISSNSLNTALFASDLMIDGQPALSLGVGFTAVHAAFPEPAGI